MSEIVLKVEKKIATVVSSPPIVCGNSYDIRVEFDDEWLNETDLMARVKFKDQYYEVPFTGESFTISIPSDILMLAIGIYTENIMTTSSAMVKTTPSVLCGKGTVVAFDDRSQEQFMENVSQMLMDYGLIVPISNEEIDTAWTGA